MSAGSYLTAPAPNMNEWKLCLPSGVYGEMSSSLLLLLLLFFGLFSLCDRTWLHKKEGFQHQFLYFHGKSVDRTGDIHISLTSMWFFLRSAFHLSCRQQRNPNGMPYAPSQPVFSALWTDLHHYYYLRCNKHENDNQQQTEIETTKMKTDEENPKDNNDNNNKCYNHNKNNNNNNI